MIFWRKDHLKLKWENSPVRMVQWMDEDKKKNVEWFFSVGASYWVSVFIYNDTL